MKPVEGELTDQDMMEFQDHVLVLARKYLLRDNRVNAAAWVLTRKMNVDARLRSKCVSVDDWQPAQDDGTSPRRCVLLEVAINYEDPRFLVNYLEYAAKHPDEFAALRAVGHDSGYKDPDKFIVDTVKEMSGVDGKDIAVRFLTKLCRETEAEAIVKVDEVWMRQGEGALPNETLENDPAAGEAIMCFLETSTLHRALVLPFTRRQRNTGKVKQFGSRSELLDCFDEQGTYRLEGRFTGILRRNEKHSAS